MRSYFANALLLTAGVFSSVSGALAQTGSYGSPALLALPDSGPQLPALAPVSYSSAGTPTPANSYGLTSSRRNAEAGQPQAADGAQSAFSAEPTAGDKDGKVFGDCGWTNDVSPCCGPCYCGGRWWVGLGGLVMTRNHANPYWTSYQTNNNPNQLLNTKDASAGWQGGGEVAIGRWFGCNDCPCSARTGFEFDYFTVGHMDGFAGLTRAGNDLSTPIDLGGVTIGGLPASDFFDNAHQHGIWRSDEFHNFEFNFLFQQARYNGGVNVTWLAGVRYFRFNETVIFGAAAGGTDFGDNGGVDSAFMRFRCENSLIGPQIGLKAEYMATNRLGIYAIPKFGIFGNSIDTNMQLYRGDGLSVYNIDGHKNDFSVLAQLDLGLNYMLTDRVRLYGGYRLVAISQLALSDNQFLPFLADVQGFSEVKSNGDLFLHGVMMGAEFRF